jgi:hypothetical protein
MTIGIAAHGPNAGLAIIKALAAVEAVGRGAIMGFVSLVAITAAGRIQRVVTQRGGSAALFGIAAQSIPDAIAEAKTAGLMASGPDRPEPLSQFTPADARVGIVTGHRMPNTVGAGGVNVNDEVLAFMHQGLTPEEAVERVLTANPDVDAGIIAMAVDGRLHAANSAYVARRGDAGLKMLGSQQEGLAVAVLHNGIQPYRPLATLAAEVAMDIMRPDDRADGWITFREGVRLAPGSANAVHLDADGAVEAIVVENAKFLEGRWNLGMGYNTRVLGRSEPVGTMLYEPYMVVDGGKLHSIDGQFALSVPIRKA